VRRVQTRSTPSPRAASEPVEDLDVLDELPQLVRDYVRSSRRGDVPVVEQVPAAELRRRLDLALGPSGCSDGELLGLLVDYLRYAVRTAHPQFHNQLFSGFSLASFLGEVASALTNTTMSTFEASPAGTLIEAEVLARLRGAIGGGAPRWESGGGILCTGGSNANLLGMLCARQRALPEIARGGLPAGVVLRAYVSEQSHYSYAKAARVLGIGSDHLVAVPCDAGGRLRPDALEQALEADLGAGRRPFFLGATAGTTVVGAYDPLEPLADLAAAHGLWLHVDGAWGGSALLSPRHRRLLAGSERCDSFAWDAHKMLGATLACSAFLLRDASVLQQATAAGEQDTEYLFHGGEDAELDSGRTSLQCGRRVDALKLWLMWKRHGDDGLAARVDHLFELADLARALVERHPRLELVARGQAPNVCFRWLPADGRDPDAFTLALRERLRRSGRALVNYAGVDGRQVVRLTLSNADLTRADVEEFFARLIQAAEELEREAPEPSEPRPGTGAGAPSNTC
jgi:glutamate/tyrosine decarboxylase-like PLP-dependent enzyme